MRPHWKAHLAELRSKLENASVVLIASDFDGTLSELVDQPEAAVLHPRAVRVLAELAALAPRVVVALLSGRALEDLAQRAGVDLNQVMLAGNHGLEMRGAGLHWSHPAAAAVRPALERLAKDLGRRTRGIAGVAVEDKGASLTLHYRRTAPCDIVGLLETVARIDLPAMLRRHDGKRVVEFRPAIEWHKGDALRAMQEMLGVADPAVVYLGDDTTDEDVFHAYRGCAITVHVGPAAAASSALLNADDPADAASFLKALVAMLSGGAA